jgi:hypothetical protein
MCAYEKKPRNLAMYSFIILSCGAKTGSKGRLWQYSKRYHETERGLSTKIASLSAPQSEGDFGTTHVNFIIKFLLSTHWLSSPQAFHFLPTSPTRNTNATYEVVLSLLPSPPDKNFHTSVFKKLCHPGNKDWAKRRIKKQSIKLIN